MKISKTALGILLVLSISSVCLFFTPKTKAFGATGHTCDPEDFKDLNHCYGYRFVGGWWTNAEASFGTWNGTHIVTAQATAYCPWRTTYPVRSANAGAGYITAHAAVTVDGFTPIVYASITVNDSGGVENKVEMINQELFNQLECTGSPEAIAMDWHYDL